MLTTIMGIFGVIVLVIGLGAAIRSRLCDAQA